MANLKQNPVDDNGKRHGEWIEHYSNGQLWYRWNYVHDVKHGLSEGYDKNSKLRYRGNWNMGIKTGYWYKYKQKKYYYLCLI